MQIIKIGLVVLTERVCNIIEEEIIDDDEMKMNPRCHVAELHLHEIQWTFDTSTASLAGIKRPAS